MLLEIEALNLSMREGGRALLKHPEHPYTVRLVAAARLEANQ